jgi:hypothetical protein
MERTTMRLGWAALVMLTLVVVATARAPAADAARPISIADESAVYDPATGTVDFTVTFDRTPNFRRVDEFGRRATSFQYFIVGDDALPDPERWDSIIRGDELSLGSGLLPIRNSAPLDPDIAAGGWGSVRATVSFRLRRRVLTFSAPLSAISDHSTDGDFAYRLEIYAFGELVDSSENRSVVPS